MKVKIFNDLTIYKKVRESVLSGEDFYKIADKFSGEEKFAEVAEDIIFGVTADESLEKIFVVMVMEEI